MTVNRHRINWRRLPGDKGRTCGAPGCGEVASTVGAQLLHADLFEPLTRLDTRTLIAHHLLTEDA